MNDSSTGLGLNALNNSEFQDNNTINTVITNINAAITTVRAQTQTFGTNSGPSRPGRSFETEHHQHAADRIEQPGARPIRTRRAPTC